MNRKTFVAVAALAGCVLLGLLWGPLLGLLLALLATPAGATSALASARAQQNAQLLQQLKQEHGLDAAAVERLRTLFEASAVLGQGNPAISQHPQTPAQCRAGRAGRTGPPGSREATEFARLCGGPHMAPLYDPLAQGPEEARACIDQYEFPDIPCEYPVVWVRASEAAQICAAMGKRLCDAHEWEGACQGRLRPPDYRFELARGVPAGEAVQRMRQAHNRAESADKRWSYGPQYQPGVCATGSAKTPGCLGGGWGACGSNTYPAGAYPACRSALGVYDLHGNAAEHMNLPLQASHMASEGSRSLGVTEMKGSWFVFDRYRAHEDWCRWRAPYWHGSRVMDPHSHANYHLGFRCCKTLDRP